MEMIVDIPIRTHLKKFILKKVDEKEPVILSKKTQLGILTIKCFTEFIVNTTHVRKMNDKLTVKFLYYRNLVFNDQNIYDFNELIENIYRTELGMFLSIRKIFDDNYERINQIGVFNNMYDITEEDIKLCEDWPLNEQIFTKEIWLAKKGKKKFVSHIVR